MCSGQPVIRVARDEAYPERRHGAARLYRLRGRARRIFGGLTLSFRDRGLYAEAMEKEKGPPLLRLGRRKIGRTRTLKHQKRADCVCSFFFLSVKGQAPKQVRTACRNGGGEGLLTRAERLPQFFEPLR